jgi:cell division protein FtsQ
MNPKVKNIIIQTAVWIMLVAFLSVSMSFVMQKRHSNVCLGSDIYISDAHQFIDENEVREILKTKGLFLQGMSCDSINLDSIEKTLLRHHQVKSVETFKTIDGRLIINIEQRSPVVRLFNREGASFYIDSDGKLMRTSARYSPRLPVVTGNIFAIPEKYSSCFPELNDTCDFAGWQLYQIFRLSEEINNDPFILSLTDQIYIKENLQIELVPRIAGLSIVLGDTKNLKEKFANLKVFFQSVTGKDGWSKYREINLSFENQIVCTKKN